MEFKKIFIFRKLLGWKKIMNIYLHQNIQSSSLNQYEAARYIEKFHWIDIILVCNNHSKYMINSRRNAITRRLQFWSLPENIGTYFC